MEHTKNLTLGGAARAEATPHHSSLFRWLRLAIALLFTGSFAGGAFAQSLTVTPSNYPTVPVGGTLQFTATANGFTISSIKWEVDNVQGGSATSGTITTGLAGGLFSAPATVPVQSQETILAVATGTNGSKYSATVYLTITPPPPVITSVLPNPLPTGTSTVTITGTGFSSNSLIWDSGVQYATQLNAAGALTATIYTGSSVTSSTFTVHDSGNISNAYPVPTVGSSLPVTYTLTVLNGTVNGSSSASFAAGTVVTIVANAAPSGQQFQSWSGASVANSNASTTTLVMPAANTIVTAGYAAVAPVTYMLNVVGGTGSGPYAAGAVVPINATIPSGQQFQSWSGATVANSSSASTTLIMPAANTTVTAQFGAAAVTYTLTVVGGTIVGGGSSGTYAAGTVVPIAATIPAGQQFQSWSGATVVSSRSASTTLTMPAANTVVTAQFAAPAGLSVVSVWPNPMPTGTQTLTVTGTGFSSSCAIWVSGVQYGAQFANNTLAASIYTGAGTQSLAVSVNCSGTMSNTVNVPVSGPPTYTLTVVGGTISNGATSGSYLAGATVTIVANAPAAGFSFTGWTGASVANSNAATTIINMPAANTTVTANFSNQPTYALTVLGGQGSGNYVAGAIVTITANNPPAGQSFLDWTGATVASASSSQTTITMPAAATTVTAIFSQPTYTLTIVNGALLNGTSTGNFPSGTVVGISAGTPPAGEYFQSWTGPGVANTASASTSITMPQANTTVTANFYTPAPIPQPVTTHPRLWVTPADLPRLQSWATNSNPVYVAYTSVLGGAIGNYQACFPGAALDAKNPTPATNYPDLGDTQGYQGVLSEENAVILAFQSLIDPNPANRIQYAQAARNLIMYALNQAALGHVSAAPGQPSVPFRDPVFAIYNRASYTGNYWPLVVDWIYNQTDANGNPILTAADKAVVQNVFIQWSNDDTGLDDLGNNPQPQGVVNSLALLPGNRPFRWASNNYYLAHARNLTMMALSIDPADDPPLNPAVPPSTIGNSLRSFILDGTGAWLYQTYAMMGDPATVAAAYNIPNNPTGAGFGLASGGLPPEGFLYGESFGFLLGHLLALQTAGFNDPNLSGPQIALIGAPVWDRYVTGFISSLTPAAQVDPAATYYGPVYQFAGYGDMLREYVTPDFMRPMALLAILEGENGSAQHLNAARWFVTNAPTGGASTLLSRVSDPWTWGVSDSMFAFMLFDPSAAAASDPRPTYPTLFYDAPAGRIVSHSDWTPNGTMFDYRASWQGINHMNSGAGQFGLFRNGEWLTKEMSNYDNNGVGQTTVYHNTLSLQNTCINILGTPATPTTPQGLPCNVQWNEPGEITNGSEFMWGASQGDPSTITSNGPGYIYAASDLTKMFNRPSDPQDTMMEVTQATRSVLFLGNLNSSDYIVVYDRASTVDSGLFKRFNLSLVNPPVTQVGANGSTITTETMNSGQQLFVQTLLPQNASASFFNGAATLNPIAELEPTQYIYQVQDPAKPSSTRFLHVLQGANSGASMVAASYVQSTTGTPFDGAVFGANAVFFPVSTSTPFAGVTLTLPAGVHTVMVAGLAPGNYTYSVAGGVITIGAGGTSAATDSAGLLTITF
jgi:uncharacterized repeat protein (TIGR02543 family)